MAIEVKSGRCKNMLPDMNNSACKLLLGGQEIPFAGFLSLPIETWMVN